MNLSDEEYAEQIRHQLEHLELCKLEGNTRIGLDDAIKELKAKLIGLDWRIKQEGDRA